MTIKIERMGEEQFQELLSVEGDTVPLYYLYALNFAPPRPITDAEAIRRSMLDVDEDDLIPYGQQGEFAFLNVLLMKVDKPYSYKDNEDDMIFILPADTTKITWELCSVISNEHNSWCYRLNPRWWDWTDLTGESPLSDAHYYFRETNTVPDFDLANTDTH